MTSDTFRGFPRKTGVIPIPSLFFTELLKKIDSIDELKVTLYIFWLVKFKRSFPRFITFGELMNDLSLFLNTGSNCSNADSRKLLRAALDLAIQRGTLLEAKFIINGNSEDIVFLNTEQDRIYLSKIINGEIVLPHNYEVIVYEKATEPLKNIYELYEQNIGIISPIIAEELKKAEDNYPIEWVVQAFKEAAELNKRSWRYVARILERWSIEGKDDGKIGGYSKKEKNTTKYVRGKYGHMVRR